VLLLLPPPPDGVGQAFARARAGAPGLAVGVHAPNRPWREQDFTWVAQGRFGAVKMMSYPPPEAYARLRRDNPRIQFAVRLDTPWNELPPPARFAAAHAPRLRALVQAGYEPWVEIGNEPNLELHPQAEAAFAGWYAAALSHLRAAVPGARYGFPGLAPGRREAAWLEANAAAIAASDWVGVHAYWADEREMLDPRRGLRLAAFHRRFPRLPLLVTEAGNSAWGVPAAERARQYARFVRTLARLPYVRAVHFFILSGTPEWRSYFFDDLTVAAVREAAREPAPVVDGLAGAGRSALAAVQPLLAGTLLAADQPAQTAPPVTAPEPVPTPAPFARRQLLVDPRPSAAPAVEPASGPWVSLTPEAPPAARLRTASGYAATHFSVQLELAPPAPGVPFALQLADGDLFAGVLAYGGGAGATGFAVLWDGEGWRLQHQRAGVVAADVLLAGVAPRDQATAEAARGAAAGTGVRQGPAEPTSSQDGQDGWYCVELALEPRSAAAWVWRRGEPQPAAPNAVFAPPEAAALDGARLRALFLPAHPVANVVLEGATRDS
jgi:hypothetical protein